METFISEKVANDSDVINFRIISIELLAPNVSKYQRSNIRSRKYLVTFEITLTADESVETHNQLTNVLSQIDNFEPDSLVIVSRKSITEESEFIDKSGNLTFDFSLSGLRLDALDTKTQELSNYLVSNITEINSSLQLLESSDIHSISSTVNELQQKIDKLELEDVPYLKKDRIKIKLKKHLLIYLYIR